MALPRVCPPLEVMPKGRRRIIYLYLFPSRGSGFHSNLFCKAEKHRSTKKDFRSIPNLTADTNTFLAKANSPISSLPLASANGNETCARFLAVCFSQRTK